MAIPTEELATEKYPALSTEQLLDMMRSVYKAEKEAENKGKLIISKEKMRELLSQLPDEVTRKFETDVVSYSVNWDDSIIKKELHELIEQVHTYTDPASEENRVAFGAFCVAVNYERRQKNITAEEHLLEKYKNVFEKGHVFYHHLVLLNRMGKATSSNEEQLKELLVLAKRNSENLTENVGGHHAFAETVALVFENAPDSMKAFLDDPKADWLGLGEAAAQVAILMDKDYAKFYCTYSRLLALKGDFESALKNIDIAIDKENSKRSDYAIRIGQYLSYSQQFRARKQLSSMETAFGAKMGQYEEQTESSLAAHQKAMEEQEKQTMVKNMEFLGLFSGIVSFTIGSLTITGAIAEQSIQSAAGLIVVLMGALMCVFAAFGMILHGIVKKTAFRNLVVFILGALIIAGGIWFCLI